MSLAAHMDLPNRRPPPRPCVHLFRTLYVPYLVLMDAPGGPLVLEVWDGPKLARVTWHPNKTPLTVWTANLATWTSRGKVQAAFTLAGAFLQKVVPLSADVLFWLMNAAVEATRVPDHVRPRRMTELLSERGLGETQ